MKAKDKFKELGYNHSENEYAVDYELINNNSHIIISFGKDMCSYQTFGYVELDGKIERYAYVIDNKTHQAITQQLLELGWL